MDDLAESQRALNRTSAGRWKLYRSHRDRLTDLVLAHLANGARRICILGAGNCNDVDLVRLAQAGAEIDLVDIDGVALERGVAQQSAGLVLPVGLHAGVDITGVWSELERLRQHTTEAALDAVAQLAEQPPALPLPAHYDMVVSPALLTQLINTAAACVGREHPQLGKLTLALRAGHLRGLLSLARPGGRAVLVTEIISNRELQELDEATDDALPGLALRAIVQQNVYAATSPAGIVSWLISNRPSGARLAPPGIVGPWRWWLSPTICYLVIGIVLERS